MNKESFESYLSEVASKDNSKLLTDVAYEEIVYHLKNPLERRSRNLTKKIKRNGFRIMNYPKFSLKDVLFVPRKKKVKKTHSCIYFLH